MRGEDGGGFGEMWRLTDEDGGGARLAVMIEVAT
ncbi:hypothetical protein Tco_1580130, partial [Tanacetum coccineum]